MNWHVKGSGNACFVVDAASGIILYEPAQPRDSKVVVTDSSNLHEQMRGRWSSATAMLRGAATTSPNTSSSDVVEGEAQAIRLSTKALKKEYNKRKKETLALERALSMSRGEAAREQEEEKR
jgi:hypothetical protein